MGGLCLLGPAAAAPQDVDVPPAPPVAGAPVTPTLERSQWLVLMVLLGEQLPADVILSDLAFNVAPAHVRAHVFVPREAAPALDAEMETNLRAHFSLVEVTPTATPDAAVYVERDITLTGIPSFETYRATRRAAQTAEHASAPEAPSAAPTPATPPAPLPGQMAPWPTVEVRRVFTAPGGQGHVAQILLDGREYIVREGRTFANRRYEFVELASTETADAPCVAIARVDSEDVRVVCVPAAEPATSTP